MKSQTQTPAKFLLLIAVTTLCSCHRAATTPSTAGDEEKEVVIYCSLDEPDVKPILQRFEKETGIRVRAVTDTEATKTTVLVERIEAEREHPRADVYWGNEIFHTINLAEQGFFAPYRPATAEDVPPKWRDKSDLYTCIGVRARVIAFSTRPDDKSLVSNLRRLEDLCDPSFKGKIGVCHPGFGTASGHFAAMFVLWGEPKYIDVMKALRANEIKLLGGNSVVADQVSAGSLVAGPTDNDDVAEGKEEKQPIDGVIPDQQERDAGTLLVPGTIALLKDCAHPTAAKRLIDYLTDARIEKELMSVGYLGYSVRGEIHVKAMNVSYVECAHQMRHAIELALTILQDRK